jgi:adenylosuccinate lyase
MRRRARIDPERIAALEAEVKHDIIAFVTQVAETVGPDGRFLHLGLTSSDVLDTGFALQLRAATDLLLAGQERLTRRSASSPSRTSGLAIGRTHGMHAEPITRREGRSWHAEAVRNRERLATARTEIAVGTPPGPSGCSGTSPPTSKRAERLGLAAEPVAA